MRIYIDDLIEEIAKRTKINEDIISARVEAFLKVNYYEKEMGEIDEMLIFEYKTKIMQFLYKQDKYTYTISSKETELQNILDFGMSGEKTKNLVEYAFCVLEAEGSVGSYGTTIYITEKGIDEIKQKISDLESKVKELREWKTK
jgi:hypothetical protein